MNPRYLILLLWFFAAQAQSEVKIELPSVPDGLASNLRARLGLSAEPCDAPRWRVQRLFKRAEQDFHPALQAFGFYSPVIEKRLDRDEKCWQAVFEVDPGPRTKVRKREIRVDGEAAGDRKLDTLLASLPLPIGAALNHAEYATIKDELRQFAAERGYLEFTFTRRELRVDPERAVADIVLHADSGPRYRFGELRISEDQPIDEDVIRRYARIKAGDPYDARAVIGLDRNLSDTGYFNRVEIRPLRDKAHDLAVPIDVELDKANRHAWRAGVGFATDTGPRASLRYDNRFVNNRGHRFESALSLSPVLSNVAADYIVPGEDPLRETYRFGARLEHEDTDTALSDSATLSARRTLKRDGGWTWHQFIELLHERSEIGDETINATLLMPGLGVERVKADDLLRTTRGYRVSLEARGAYKGLLSTATLFRVTATAKGIYRLGEGGRITARADIGTTLGGDIDDLPASLRFFAGGDNSVRGYEYESLGPRDRNDEPKGGRHLLTTSLEYEHPVFGDDWWVAAFVDAGNAFNTDEIDLRVGYGVGLRWYSPVGRVRFDIAIPDDTSEDDWRIHFGLGADL